MNDPVISCPSADEIPDWPEHAPWVKKIVIGEPPIGGEKKPLSLDSLPDRFAARFPNLTHLYLWQIEGLRELPALPAELRCLDVRGCVNLKSLPDLPGCLETLDLAGCSTLSKLPSELPSRLQCVYLEGCKGLKLFAPVKSLLGGLRRLQLHGCRFADLTDLLCGEEKENVAGKVRAHFDAIESQGAAALPECKVVVLGNGGVGKTSLVRALKGLSHIGGNAATEGIKLWSWDAGGFVPFPGPAAEKVQLNVWDFGGQDLYHNTHRIFLETRAVFVVVWRQPCPDGKPFRPEHPDDPVRPLNYWLDQVFAANPLAQVLIVRTGMDKDAENPPDDWRLEVREEYRALPAFDVSAKSRGIGQLSELRDELRGAVARELRSGEAICLGRGRRAVRDELRQWQPPTPDDDRLAMHSARPIMRLHEFIRLVEEVFHRLGLDAPSEDEPLMLLDYLHHSGAVYCPPSWRSHSDLHGAFPIIVDQRWAIEGIYAPFRARDVRDELVAAHGMVTEEMLATEVWGPIRDENGEPCYDELAQWVFIRFMLSCGVLVRVASFGAITEDVFILPELLPSRGNLAKLLREDPLIAAAQSDSERREYLIRHRSLGQGFGCLLVGQLIQMFGKVPLYRYGGIGRIRLESDKHSRGHDQDAIVEVKWHKETNDAYYGDLMVTVYGESSSDGEMLHYLEGELRKIPGFPSGTAFETASGPLPRALQTKLSYFKFPHDDAHGALPARGILRLGLVGFSVAGEDKDNPGIELFSKALQRRLNAKTDRCFDVLYYHSDEERKLVSQLISDLVRSDLMLAFVGRKYLHSEYCMVELLEAARRLQPQNTFESPSLWPNKLWLLPLTDAGPLLARTDAEDSQKKCDSEQACQEWKRQWVNRAARHLSAVMAEFRGLKPAEKEAPRKYAYHSWMQFAGEDEEGLGLLLAALKQSRHPWRQNPSSSGAVGQALEDWACECVKPLAEAVERKMQELTSQMLPAEREEQARTVCLRLWASDKTDLAVDAFQRWIESHPDSSATREEFLDPAKSLKVSELEPVRVEWRKRQGLK